jgi:hypothetical protein
MLAATGFGLTAVERCGAVAEQLFCRCIGQPPWNLSGQLDEGAAWIGGAQQIWAAINATPASRPNLRPVIEMRIGAAGRGGGHASAKEQ